MRHEDYNIELSERLKTTLSGSRRGFKGFLYHINKDKDYTIKLLRLKVPKKRPKTLTKDNIDKLIGACGNERDRFLIRLLWETGMRIGEALALWLEDFEIDATRIHIRDRGELPNNAEIKTLRSPRTIDVSHDLMNVFMDYIAEFHNETVDTNHVFINLTGETSGQPMRYSAVVSLFKRLKKKTGIEYVSPHKFRHTHFSTLRKAGWEPEKILKRGGWASVQTPMQTYLHTSDEEMRNVWDQVENEIKLREENSPYDNRE